MRRYNIDERKLVFESAVEDAVTDAYKRGKLDDAKKMLAKGYSVADIIDITNLPKAQIRALKVS